MSADIVAEEAAKQPIQSISKVRQEREEPYVEGSRDIIKPTFIAPTPQHIE